MRHSLRCPTGLLFLTLLAAPSLAAQSDRLHNAYWVCYSAPDQETIYVTSAWDARAVPDDVYPAFGRFLKARYNYTGQISCAISSKTAPGASLAKAQSDQVFMVNGWHKAGKKTIAVDWTSSSPPEGPKPARYAMCYGGVVAAGGDARNGPYDTYLSQPFDAGDATTPAQEEAFTKYIRDRYHITTPDLRPICSLAGDATMGQRMFDALKTQWSRRGKVIETGWVMKP